MVSLCLGPCEISVGEMVSAYSADIDGTLCMKGEDLMPLTRSAIKKLHAEGVKFGLATGRPVDSRVLSYAEKWDLGFPVSNSASVSMPPTIT